MKFYSKKRNVNLDNVYKVLNGGELYLPAVGTESDAGDFMDSIYYECLKEQPFMLCDCTSAELIEFMSNVQDYYYKGVYTFKLKLRNVEYKSDELYIIKDGELFFLDEYIKSRRDYLNKLTNIGNDILDKEKS